jgi:PAS domain S-box-containing protein
MKRKPTYQELQKELKALKSNNKSKLFRDRLFIAESKLDEIQQITKLGYWELNILTNKLTWSNEIFRIFGLKVQEFEATYDAFLEKIHPEDRDKVNEAYVNSLKNKTPYKIKHRILLNSGKIKHVLERCKTEYNSKGEPVRSIGTVLDITEQIELEAILKDSEAKFKKLSNLTFEGILIHDNGIAVDMNNSFLDLFGYSYKEILKKNIIELLFPKKFHQIISKSLKKKYTRPFEIEGVKKDGSIFPIEIEARDFISENNKKLSVATIRDISERIKTEAENKKLLLAIEQSANSIIITDINGNIEYTNPKFSELTGYKLNEVLGKNPRVLKSGHQKKEFYDDLWQTISNGKNWKGTFKNVDKNGKSFWERATISPVIDNNGVITNYLGVKEDVSELKESEEKFKLLLESSEDMITIHDLKGNYLYYNGPSCYDLRPEDVIGKSPYDFFEKDNAHKIVKSIESVGKSGKSKMIELNLNWFNKKKWFSEYFYPILDGQKGEVRIVKVCRDITDRKKVEIENIKLSTVVEQSANSIIITDTSGKIEYINPSFKKITGYSSEDILGKRLYVLSSHKHTFEFYKELWKTIKAGKIWKGEIQNKTKSGKLIWEQIIISPIKNNVGEITNYLSISEDITLLKKAVKSLKTALIKAKESDKLKSSFLANMSHEIRTPMNGIIGFSEFLMEPDLSYKKRVEYSRIVIDNSKLLLAIVNDILDISKIEAGIVKINYEKVNINGLIDELYSFYQPKANEKRLNFHYIKGLENNQSIIDIDKTKLNQVLSNLLSNAFKFTEEGNIGFGYQLIENELKFFVEDTGLGIDGEFSNKIFERFIQGNHDVNRLNTGTGLGLAISKKIIELFGGEIWFDSSREGTTMYFTIPYKRKKAPITSTFIEEDNGGDLVRDEELTILVAEDEEYNMMYINELFTKTKFKIIEANNGAQAVNLFKKHPEIDLVLMDIQMPVMNGKDAMIEIKKIKPVVPVIALSAFAMESDKKDALKNGFNFHLSKPINSKLLFDIISKCSN